MKKLQPEGKPARVVTIMPTDLYERVLRQSGKETTDRKRRITPSEIVRWAVEEYLDQWETATFVPSPKGE